MERTVAVARTCNLPLEVIADQLETNAAAVLQPATAAAVVMTNDIVLTLDSKWAWFDLQEDVHARTGELIRSSTEASLPISWEASAHKRLLPAVDGHLGLYPMSGTYTEISFAGHYMPQPGLFATVGERLMGRRVIEAAIGHLLDEIVAHLEQLNPNPAKVS